MDMRRHSIGLPNTDPTTGRHEIVFYDWGDVDSQHPVMCVHGLTRNGMDFLRLAEELARRGRRVFAPSMAGRGESAWLTDPIGYGYGTYMADCLAIMDNFHLRHVDWVGTSMGGIVGMMVAAMHPKRIRKLVLNDVGSFIPKEALIRIFTYLDAAPRRFDSRAAASDYLKTIYAPFGIPPGEAWEFFVDHSIRTQADGSIALACDPSIIEPVKRDTKDLTEVKDADLRALWEEVHAPTLILHGELSDVLSAETVRAMKATHPRAVSATIPGVGHAPALISPGQVDIVADFLSPSFPRSGI